MEQDSAPERSIRGRFFFKVLFHLSRAACAFAASSSSVISRAPGASCEISGQQLLSLRSIQGLELSSWMKHARHREFQVVYLVFLQSCVLIGGLSAARQSDHESKQALQFVDCSPHSWTAGQEPEPIFIRRNNTINSRVRRGLCTAIGRLHSEGGHLGPTFTGQSNLHGSYARSHCLRAIW